MTQNTGIRVRAYNVGFGDCFLVSLPDEGRTKHMLIDFGNAPGQSNTLFADIAADIRDETGGHIDVLVMTHEHLDHMEGFYSQKAIFNEMQIDYVWMSLPSAPDYYTRFPEAEVHQRMRAMADQVSRTLTAHHVEVAPSFEAMLRNNLSNVDRVAYLRGLPGRNGGKPLYLARGNSIRNKPFSPDVSCTILAPERDASFYYSASGHSLNAMAAAFNAAAGGDEAGWWDFAAESTVNRPPNLSMGDWNRLKDSIQGGTVEAVRSIDKAQNNTSLVFLLEVAGKRLLFPGDAEIESWETFAAKHPCQMRPIDFMKVSHHGSHNGTLRSLLDTLLPVDRADQATIMVSTKSKVYGTTNPVPDEALLTDLGTRTTRLLSTEDDEAALYVDAHL